MFKWKETTVMDQQIIYKFFWSLELHKFYEGFFSSFFSQSVNDTKYLRMFLIVLLGTNCSGIWVSDSYTCYIVNY